MNDPTDLRRLLIAYKLGELSLEDRQQLDEHMLGAQEFSDRLAEAEYDLIDDYRAGRLSRSERSRVKAAYPLDELRQKTVVPFIRGSSREPLRPRQSGSRLRLNISLAAASLVLIAAASFLIFEHPGIHKGHETAGSPRTALSGSSPDSAAVKPPEASPGLHESHQVADFATLLLGQAVTRGTANAELDLHPSSRIVRVQWIVPSTESSGKFSLSLARGGALLASVDQQGKVREIGGSEVAEFHLPASLFAGYPEDTHFLLAVYAGSVSRIVVAEYAVTIHRDR